jgi:hypothetical protein
MPTSAGDRDQPQRHARASVERRRGGVLERGADGEHAGDEREPPV